jgi:hypothetical protein
MRAVKKFNRGAINFNVGQYAVGIDGTNGFAIADWLGLSSLSISAILEFKVPFTYDSGAWSLFYLSDNNAANFSGLTVGIGGPWTVRATNEYITMSRISSGAQDWHRSSLTESLSYINFITWVYSSSPAIYLNGALVAGANTAINLITATAGISNITRLSLGALWNGLNATGRVKARDISFFGRAITLAEHQSFWAMYGGTQNKLGFEDNTMKAHSLYKEAIELYTGRKENNVLIAEKKTSHNLQLMGF